MTSIVAVLGAALLVTCSLSIAPFNGEFKSFQKVAKNGKSYTTFEIEFGGADGSEKQSAEFLINFGFQNVLIGNIDQIGWGVHCDKRFGCNRISDKEIQYFYNYKQIFAKRAVTRLYSPAFAPLEKQDPNDHFSLPRNDVAVEMGTRGDVWNFANAGVLGLSPYGSYVSFLRNRYMENLSFLPFYKSDHKKPSELVWTERLFVNPIFPRENLMVTVQMSQGDQFWTVRADLLINSKEDREWGFKNQHVCLTNSEEDILVAVDPVDRCQHIQKLICNGATGKRCTTHNADLSKAPELNFQISGQEFKFGYKEYLYPGQNEEIKCRFGDASALRPQQTCHPEALFAIGKLFFEKYPIILNFTRYEKPSVSFISFFHPPTKRQSWSKQQIALAVFGVTALALLMIYVYIKKVKSDNAPYPEYVAANSQEVDIKA